MLVRAHFNTKENTMSKVDEFYPKSAVMAAQPDGMWQLGLVMKMEEHLAKARRGDRLYESKLINRIGQLRRCVEHFDQLQTPLQDTVREAVAWVRSTGRAVNLSVDDPRYWITARDGKSPRW